MRLGKKELWILRECNKNPLTVYPGYAETMRRLRRKGLLKPEQPWEMDNVGSELTQIGLEILSTQKNQRIK